MAIEWETAARRARDGKLTEAQARSVINSIMEHAGQEPVTFYKTRQWLNEWIGDKKISSRQATILKYEPVIRRFLEHIGVKADGGLANLTPANIRSFRNLLHQEGRAAQTVNQIVSKVLSAPLAKAVSLGYMPVNPCKAVEPLKETQTEAGVFSIDQIQGLLKVSPSENWTGLIMAGFYTGQRLGDLVRLTWRQVDLPKKMIFIDRQQKSQSGVAIPIHQDLMNYFLARPSSDNPDEPVFPSLCSQAGGGRNGLSEAFKRVMVKAGITLTKRLESAGGVGRGRNKLSFHSLRHSFNSALANAGVPQEIRQKLTGHRDAKSHQLYTHFDYPALKNAVETVPSVVDRSHVVAKKARQRRR
ncbi:MAG TPA: tyrosine-type recombinase/integrase [Candidatus Bathyarchaeia archaeon]|nr:tyrosine-type recombinase/integrase [Candidatus Bathyarchaeia archaeon]